MSILAELYTADTIRYLFALALAVIGISLAWGKAIDLRTEQIRSVAVVAMVCVLVFSLARLPEDVPPTWHFSKDPYFLLAIWSEVILGLIAWGAAYIKGKIAGQQIAAGIRPTGDINNPLNEPARQPAPHPEKDELLLDNKYEQGQLEEGKNHE